MSPEVTSNPHGYNKIGLLSEAREADRKARAGESEEVAS